MKIALTVLGAAVLIGSAAPVLADNDHDRNHDRDARVHITAPAHHKDSRHIRRHHTYRYGSAADLLSRYPKPTGYGGGVWGPYRNVTHKSDHDRDRDRNHDRDYDHDHDRR